MKRNDPAPRPAQAPFKRTLTLALLGHLAAVSLAQAGVPPVVADHQAYAGHEHVWAEGPWER